MFEEVEAVYLEQVEQIKVLAFKRGYDVDLSDAGVSEDSPLWTNYAARPKGAFSQPPPPEIPAQDQAREVGPPVVGDEGTFAPVEPTPPASSVS
ncbi:hypothetical protein MRB53_006130 [Persea americana]|uniref:Uncharacterized protein n=1 Tax=Persea americana TaxID=3435 RepID=A0ACC2MF46_PERAE|nr:hypothetical protein MRB53_006130 [Persea americana]